jgi:hypothetical protein
VGSTYYTASSPVEAPWRLRHKLIHRDRSEVARAAHGLFSRLGWSRCPLLNCSCQRTGFEVGLSACHSILWAFHLSELGSDLR